MTVIAKPKPKPTKPEAPIVGKNRKAVEETLRELRRLGRIEKIDAANVQMLRSMADALDAKPFNSQMWKEYREALWEMTADGDDADAIGELLDHLRGEVRDEEAD